jgi:hypothetical protein
MKIVDQIFGWLLILATCGHTLGTFLLLPFMSDLFIWSLGSALASGLLGVLNLIRARRPEDKTLALITAIGTACWAVVALAFGKSIHNLLDLRVLMHFLTSAALVGFSVRTLRRSASPRGVLSSAARA